MHKNKKKSKWERAYNWFTKYNDNDKQDCYSYPEDYNFLYNFFFSVVFYRLSVPVFINYLNGTVLAL